MTTTATTSRPQPLTAPVVPGRARRAIWAAVLAAVVALLAVAAIDDSGAETDQERIQRLSASYACPECQGESVAESSAAVAANIRQFIADEVARGATDEEIRNALVRSYGVRILLNPPAEGLATLLWVLPVVLLAAGAGGIVAVFDRARAGDRPVTDADRSLVASAREERRSRLAAGADRVTATSTVKDPDDADRSTAEPLDEPGEDEEPARDDELSQDGGAVPS